LAFLEIIMVADALMRPGHGRFGAVSRADIAAGIELLGQRPGVAAARKAVALAEPNVASPPETWVRMVMLDAGLPRGIPNAPVRPRGGGSNRFLDVRVGTYAMGVEYQGAWHFEESGQARDDLERREQLRDLGIVIIEAKSEDLRDQRRLVGRVAREIARFEGLRLPRGW
jgi:hypothetical protein